MVDRICVVLEALSIAVCLHRLYGKKFRFDIATASLMTIEMIMMQAIDYFGWPKELSMLFYPIIAGYCVIEFGFNLKELIINNVLNAVIICSLQISIMALFHTFDKHQVIIGMKSLLLNSLILMIIMFLFPKLKIEYIKNLVNKREKVLIITIIICLIVLTSFLIDFKRINIFNHFDLLQYILLFACVTFIVILVIQLLQYKVKSKEVEIELKMHRLYADSFDNLINNIRSRQHEFDNHINTIYSQQYIYDTYDKLIEAQKKYCKMVITENRFNKLLTSGNRVIIGFLYGKFVDIDKVGIDISYRINIGEMNVGVPIYKFIEILGNLLDNAVDALQSTVIYNKIYVFMLEDKDGFSIEIRNESDYIKYKQIELFFTKGYSQKGEDRGLGLYHTKNICDEYELKLSCKNKEIEGVNWLSFTISNNRGCCKSR